MPQQGSAINGLGQQVEMVPRFKAYHAIDLEFTFSDKLTDMVKSVVDTDKDPCCDRKLGTTKLLNFASPILFKLQYRFVGGTEECDNCLHRWYDLQTPD